MPIELPPVPQVPLAVMGVYRHTDTRWELLNSIFQLWTSSHVVLVVHARGRLSYTELPTDGNWIDIITCAGQFWRGLGVVFYGGWQVFGAANMIQPMLQDARDEVGLGAMGSVRDILESRFPSMKPEARDRRGFTANFCEWLTGRAYSDDVDGVARFLLDVAR